MQILAVVGLIVASIPALAQSSTFHADVNLVNVTFGVRNFEGKLVGDLNQQDVEILEDSIPQKIRFFSRTSDLPLTIGLLVDASDSQHSFYKKHHRDVENFLKDVLGPKDQAFLVCFGNHIRLVSDLTSSVDQVMEAFDRFEHSSSNFPELGPPENRREGTALFDSIVYATREKFSQIGPARRVLVVFSDGEDNSSAFTEMDAIQSAQTADVLVYAIRYTEQKGRPTSRNKYGARIMHRLARDTGASDFDAARDKDMDATFRQIGDELRSMYEVGYHASNPTRDGTFRKVLVRTSRQGLIVSAKSGYFAEP